jgi:hypothetical protein
MLRVIVAVTVAVSFASLDAADAAGKRKRKKVHAHPAATMPMKPSVTRPGPSWAGPNDCYTDEGYGRYVPCSGGMDM